MADAVDGPQSRPAGHGASSASPAHATASPRVLYATRYGLVPWLVSGFVALVAWGSFGFFAGAVLLADDGPHVLIAGAILLFPVLVTLLLGFGVLGNSFVITTEGIRIRDWGIARTYPWARIARVEWDRGSYLSGATMLLLDDGHRVRSAMTAARYALHRGESPADYGEDGKGLSTATRAAIDAHVRYLRGEFDDPTEGS
jgi:hypothetical protein